MKSQSVPRRAVCLAGSMLAGLALATALLAQAEDSRTPDLPSGTEKLAVPTGNKVLFHAYAAGGQIYVCRNISTTEARHYAWVFKAPRAELFANEDLTGQIGIHYAGPTWEGNSDGRVVGAVVERATVNPDAIPWLLLKKVSADGPGIFELVTYIQRVHTSGGLAPTTECSEENEGEEVSVPYTAEYYFYRSSEE